MLSDLFIIVQEALSREIRSTYMEELLYNDLALVSETLNGLRVRVEASK